MACDDVHELMEVAELEAIVEMVATHEMGLMDHLERDEHELFFCLRHEAHEKNNELFLRYVYIVHDLQMRASLC